jgi:hypothetical protein
MEIEAVEVDGEGLTVLVTGVLRRVVETSSTGEQTKSTKGKGRNNEKRGDQS